jgi:hypothetical protein
MSLAGLTSFERMFDKIAPALLLTMGLLISAAFAAVVGVV